MPYDPAYAPALQFARCAHVVAPTALEYVPGLQRIHVIEPPTLYSPALQFAHNPAKVASPVAEPYVPYVPGAQLIEIHAARPVVLEYVPSLQ